MTSEMPKDPRDVKYMLRYIFDIYKVLKDILGIYIDEYKSQKIKVIF